MLHPTEFQTNFFKWAGTPDDPALANYRVTGYARFQDYTRVFWRADVLYHFVNDSTPHSMNGECLFKNGEMLLTSGTRMMYYTPKRGPERSKNSYYHDPLPGINPTVGMKGVSAAVAIALEDRANWVIFEL